MIIIVKVVQVFLKICVRYTLKFTDISFLMIFEEE
jgi:hypothetical protein